MGYIKGIDRRQAIMFPESIEEYIHEDNPVRVIDEYVEQLNMKELGFERSDCPKIGRPPYHPKDLLKLYLYGYLHRIRSSRRLEQEAIRNIEVMWLLRKLTPDFKTIADFRKNNTRAIKGVFRKFVLLCHEWGLFGKELAAVDGTKVRACNAKRNNYSAKKLAQKIKYIDTKIDAYLQKLEETDQSEANCPNPPAEEIQKRVEELRSRKEKYEGYQEKMEKIGVNEISTTDPDARLMSNNNNNVDVSYNIQTTVDAKHKLIADFKVTQQPNDLGELAKMALRYQKLFGLKEFEVVADKGYYKAEDLKRCVKNHITPYVSKQVYSNGTGDRDFYADRFRYDAQENVYRCPGGQTLYYERQRTQKDIGVIGYRYSNYATCQSCGYKKRCTKGKKGRTICRHVDQDFLDTIDRQTEMNKDKYKQRQMIIEHVFGTVKRSWEAYYFLTKRKLSVRTEISLSFLAYNFKRVMNILGIREMLQRLRERSGLAPA